MYLTRLRRTGFWTSKCISVLLKVCLVMFLLPHSFTFNLMFPRTLQQQVTKRNASSSFNIVGYTEDNNNSNNNHNNTLGAIQVKRFALLYKSGHSHTFFITSYIFELSLVLLLFLHLQTAANSSYVRTSLAIKAILTLIMLVHNLTDYTTEVLSSFNL